MHHPGLMTRIELDLAVACTGGHHFDPTPLKLFANDARQHEGLGGIAMQTQTVIDIGMSLHSTAADSFIE